MNPNLKRDLIAHFPVGVNYNRLIGGKYAPLRQKEKKSEEMRAKRERGVQ